MKRRVFPSAVTVLLATVIAHLPATATACTACMGDPNSKAAGAINAAIFLMLGFIALMLGSFAAFGWYLSRRTATAGPTLSAADFDAAPDQPDELS